MRLLSRLLVVLLIVTPATASEKKTSTLKTKTLRALASRDGARENKVRDYFKCFEAIKDSAKIRACVDKVLYSKLSEGQKERFYSWLTVIDAHLKKFNKCGARIKKEAAFFPESTLSFVCGTINVGGTTREAIFFFNPELHHDEKLSSIYY